MDPGGSDLESSLPQPDHPCLIVEDSQPDNPCLIVEDSQPDSAAVEDDPDSSYRALLARRLSSLQPPSHSPVLRWKQERSDQATTDRAGLEPATQRELISSPAGSRCSQTDSQSEEAQCNNQPGSVNLESGLSSSTLHEERSQVLEVCSVPPSRRCAVQDKDMESGADSTTHCAQSESVSGGASQFGFLELSESQGVCDEVGNSQEEEEEDSAPAGQTDSQRHSSNQAEQNTARTSGSQDSKSKRSEVSSSSSSEPQGRAGRELSVQALLHSQALLASGDQDDSEILSSQEELFDADRTGVDSTVSELENQGQPTLTPAHTLRLLHLSGHGTLVQESLSQNSVDFVAPTQDDLSQTPFIVPNSPTGLENELGSDEPMDTSLPPGDQSGGKEEEPMDTDTILKPRPSASTPISQNSPAFVLEKTLSLITQPEFSHDVFVPTPTQSQEAGSCSTGQESHKRKVTSSSSSSSQQKENPSTAEESGSSKMASAAVQPKNPIPGKENTVTDSFQLELSVNTESCRLAQQQASAAVAGGEVEGEEDSQATQIEGLDEPLGIDTTDSAMSLHSQGNERNGVPSEPKSAAILPKVPHAVLDSRPKPGSGECARVEEECNSLQKKKSDAVHKQTSSTVNVVRSVNVRDSSNVTKTGSSQTVAVVTPAAKVSSSQTKLETVDLTSPSQPKLETVDLTTDSCVLETPSSSNSAPCSLSSQSQPQSQSVFQGKGLSKSSGVCEDLRGAGAGAGGGAEGGGGGGGGVSNQTAAQVHRDPATPSQSSSQGLEASANDRQKEKNIGGKGEEGEEEGMEEEEMEEGEKHESTSGADGSGFALALSQSQMLSPEPMEEVEGGEEEEEEGCSVIVLEESERSSQLLEKEVTSQSSQSKRNTAQPMGSRGSVSSNGTGSQPKDPQPVSDKPSQSERGGSQDPVGLRGKSFSDSSGDIPFHFTLPKEGELIGPAVSATPPLINQLKQTQPRHSTPIEMTSFSEKSASAVAAGDVSTETAMAASAISVGESGEDSAEGADGKLSLRMKLVTPVEEGSSERFSLQKPPLSDEESSVSKVTAVAKAVTSALPSPSVFSRVREAHRQLEEEDAPPSGPGTPIRGELFSTPPPQGRNSQRPSLSSPTLGCHSLPNSQSQPCPSSPLQEVTVTPPPPSEARRPGAREKGPLVEPSTTTTTTPGRRAEQPSPQPGTSAGERERPVAPEPSTPTRAVVRQKAVSQQTSLDGNPVITASPSSKLRQRAVSQQTSLEALFPPARGEPAHRRHVRTIQEVRTTVTRVITDVYYEDGREVDRKVSEESEEPVVENRVLDSSISPCRTGSSVTSGDLGDVSSMSSKASSLQLSSSGSTGIGPVRRPDFIMPPSRGAKSASPRRGSGQQQRGGRGQAAGSEFIEDRGSRAVTPLTPRGRARRGRPPSRSPLTRGGGTMQRGNARGQPPHYSSEDEPYTRVTPLPRVPDSPAGPGAPSPRSDSLLTTTTSPEEGSQAGSSFVGLRVVAKWSSNGYFYSGCIKKDCGEGRFRLLFDDSYECEVSGKDILLCDPIPLETEVTALLEDEYFSLGIVKGHKTEGQQLFYSVEREGKEKQWYSRSSVILSMEQSNKLREQFGLGPYEPSTPLAKASDISLDNLVEGKRRRRGNPGGGQETPNRSSTDGHPTPGPSGKRKLISSAEEERRETPAKRGRRGGSRAGQRVGLCNTSGSGADLPRDHSDLEETHGPLPQSASLFMGFAFMLTASSEDDRQTNQPTADGEEEYVQTAPYNKGYTETQLEAGGAFILHDFNEEQCKAAYQSLLIADQHCRTRKYLLCVASGVPCVSHIWVRDCCQENKLLNYRNYLLPAGVGPNHKIMEWHPRCSPFKALRVLLVLKEPMALWSELLTMSGAASVRQHQADKDSSDIPTGKFDVVVTDHTCPPLVLKSVTSQDVPLVSPEWLIQSLICGERLEYHSNPQYRHDTSSSS